MKPAILVALSTFAMLTSTVGRGASLVADLLILNATVRTMDPAQPKADAVAIAGNRIAAVGSTADLRPLAGPRTRVIDTAGPTVLPGFNDAHVHWLGGGFSITNVDLRDASSPAELARRLGEHAQHLRPDEIRRFAAQKVIASMQPYHCADDGRWCEKRIGPERAKGTYAFRSLLDAGAVLAFGTDWTVAPLNPMQTLKAAVTRQTLDGKHPGGWVAEQKITLEEAIRAYTVGSAYAEFQENVKGSIAPGKLADLVVLDRDIFAMNPAELDQVDVTLTVVDGRIAYEAKR